MNHKPQGLFISKVFIGFLQFKLRKVSRSGLAIAIKLWSLFLGDLPVQHNFSPVIRCGVYSQLYT